MTKVTVIFYILVALCLPFSVSADVSDIEIGPLYASLGVREGSVIGSETKVGDPDIYIINEYGYKRLFVSPAIFNLYGHLTGGYSGVVRIESDILNALPTSGLFRNCETDDKKVYVLEVAGEDVGVLHWLDVDARLASVGDSEFFKKVFCINTAEFNLYQLGQPYSSLASIPNYSRSVPTPQPTFLNPVGKEIAYNESTWKTYSNAKYGFNLRYPDSWNETKFSDEGAFFHDANKAQSDVPDLLFSVGDNSEGVDIKAIWSQANSGDGGVYSIAGMDGYKIKGSYGYFIGLPKGTAMLIFSSGTDLGIANFETIIGTMKAQ